MTDPLQRTGHPAVYRRPAPVRVPPPDLDSPRKPTVVQVSVKLEDELLDRVERAAMGASPAGIKLTLTNAVRIVLEAGLASLEKSG
jgi:hypothetical protein